MNALREVPSLNPNHRSDDVVDYHFGDLSPEARAEFEQHLGQCLGCRRALKTAGLVFSALPEALAVPKRRRTVDELLEIMAEEEKRLQAEHRKSVRASVRRAMYWAAPFVAAAAAVAAGGPVQTVEWIVAKATGRPTQAQIQMAAPPRPVPPKPEHR
jgi:predicted anti-sigma-YlaC factor YlaD